MIVAVCQHENRRTNGTTKAGTARFRCKDCGKSFTESTEALGGMRIGMDRAVQIVTLLCEGMSVLATARITDTDPHTILDLLVYLGERCETYTQEHIRNICADNVQVDEIWQFVLCKQATAKKKRYVGGCGDSFCFTAVDRDTKFLLAWHHGKRTEKHTAQFIAKLDRATYGRMHISTDGFKSYPSTIRKQLGNRVDHGVMMKIYGSRIDEDKRTYSPARILGASRTPMHGNPDQMDKICTSHVERLNGSIRCFSKRMARLTYCFSKKWTNHRAAPGLFFMHYNYCRKHRSLKGMTPAMAHGLTTEAWTVRRLISTVTSP